MALLLPFIMGEFWVHVVNEILIMGLFAVSFNMIFGYMGQLSFGHAAYFGIGAYATGLLIVKVAPLPLCLAVSMISAGLAAVVFGYFCVRLTGIYFAILTLAFGQLMYYIVFQWYSFTGGDDGLQGVVPPEILFGVNAYYYFTLVIVTLALIAMWFISESPFGFTMRSIRDNGAAPASSASTCAVHAHEFHHSLHVRGPGGRPLGPLQPDHRAGPPLLAPLRHPGLHGRHRRARSFLGPLLGSIIYTFLMAFITGFTEYWPMVIGTIIILVVLFAPGGLIGIWRVGNFCHGRGSEKVKPGDDESMISMNHPEGGESQQVLWRRPPITSITR